LFQEYHRPSQSNRRSPRTVYKRSLSSFVYAVARSLRTMRTHHDGLSSASASDSSGGVVQSVGVLLNFFFFPTKLDVHFEICEFFAFYIPYTPETRILEPRLRYNVSHPRVPLSAHWAVCYSSPFLFAKTLPLSISTMSISPFLIAIPSASHSDFRC
jgi:hypothetical protein